MTTTSKQAYLLARIAIGASLFGHGIVRMPILNGFVNFMLGQFSKSYLPIAMVKAFSYALPFAELLTGLFILLGLFTRQAYIAGSLIMISLVFGSTSIQAWEAIPSQLIHIGFLVVLLAFEETYNSYRLDKLIGR